MKRQHLLIRGTSKGEPSIKVYTPSARAARKSGGKLIDQVSAACRRLAPAGWRGLMRLHGLDISAKHLAPALSRPLANIDRSLPAFQDFAWADERANAPR